MSRFAILLGATLCLPVGGCMMKPRHLVYPDGVVFTGWHVPNFEICNWSRDPNNPQPCPVVVHLPAGDLGDKELSDAAALKWAGWEEQDNGNGNTSLWLRAGTGQVNCNYRGAALVGASVSTLSSAGSGPVALSVNGKRVILPATAEAITATLGQPLRRD